MKDIRLLMLVVVAALVMPVQAARRSEQQMRAAAIDVLKASRPMERVAVSEHMTAYNQRGGGFALISTDDKAPAVLAYSMEGSFETTTSNPGFNWWLRAVKRASLKETTKPDPSRFKPWVEPLTTTKWGQNEPFRYMCPFLQYDPDLSHYGVYIPDSTHNAVGCGPAAMAQLMKYYNYPKHGKGSASVVVKYDQANVTLSVDLENTTYEWGKMLDDYSGDYTDENGKAAAELCYHAAVAAQAYWNSLGGGTFDENILSAMINNFSYNPSAQVLNRPLYDEPAWMEMIYRMLSDGHPVLYSGKDINFEVGLLVGHNFIIDGYDENGLVHVNWGWHGQQDGYFDIATLQVGKLSFDDWQGMYLDLYPIHEELTGDVDCDGTVTAADITALYNFLLGDDTTFLSTSDVDGDGTVTSADVTMIYNILLGI